LYYPDFLSEKESDLLLESFLEHNGFEQRSIKLFGKEYDSPRLEQFCAFDSKTSYSYSNKKLKTQIIGSELDSLIEKLNELKYSFNSVLINYYRDGQDSNGWHRDNEKELGEDPVIMSISVGAKRRFKIQSLDKSEKFDIELEHGSLLIMKEGSQLFYRHQLPKMLNLAEPRINFTFRYIY
jgi:alkylated DNA repair dioxygenase AlkB